MKMEHLIIEGFCAGNEKLSTYPCNGKLKFGIHCLKCSQFSYTYCPNEIALSDSDGIVVDWIGFGGIMEPSEIEKRDEYIAIWNTICKDKMNEAYDDFLKQVDLKDE